MTQSPVKVFQQQKKRLKHLAQQVKILVFDFDGVFTDNRVLVLQDGTEGVFCSRADGFGLEAVRALGINLIVLSTEKNPVVSQRCKKLHLHCIQGCKNKSDVLQREAKILKIPLEKVAYMGNDINDLECLSMVGLSACVADAHPDVIATSLYITEAKGGHGAVREFCEFIIRACSEKEPKE